MKRCLLLILSLTMLVSCILCGCSSKPAPEFTGEYYLAQKPSDEEKGAIDKVLSSFMKSYEENKPEDAYPLFTNGFSGTTDDLKSFFEEIRKVCKNPFVPFDSYYLSGMEVSETPVKVKHSEQDKTYIEITPASEDSFCAIYVAEGEKVSYMLSILLAKEDDSWKIAWVNPGEVKYNGADAPAIYEKTKTLYNEGKLISAYIYSCMLGNTFRPGDYMRYENDLEMEDMCYKLYSEMTSKFESPIVIEGEAKSEVHAIRIIRDEVEGMIPLILVKTDVDIKDRDALVAEAEKVIGGLEALSPGIRETFTHASFSMTNENIDENNPTPKAAESFVLPLNP